ncbi:MAG: crotonase/enoyl-CoA hydratase family protein [Rhodospirillaceae bacterium]|jgi:enoyl-CoA hydratase/carnithine racemase
MADEVVSYELEGEIALIGLNRPEKRNAFNDEVRTRLIEAAVRANEEAKVGIVFGHGDHFCAGLDLAHLKDRMAKGQRMRDQVTRPDGARGFDIMARGDIPFISALKGAVIGGGLEIAASTHIRVADKTAFFALPEGQRGIYVGGGGSVRVARLMGVPRMMDMMLTGRVMSVDEAERHNVVQYIVDEGQEMEKAKELALQISKNRPQSNFAMINGLPRIYDMGYNDGLFVESLLVASIYDENSAQRIDEFLQKKAKRIEKPDE